MNENESLSNRLQILDCTLRDGGWDMDGEFGQDIIKKVSSDLFESGFNAVECGFLKWQRGKRFDENTTDRRYMKDYAMFGTPSKVQMRTAMIADVDYPLADIPLSKDSPVDFVRVVIRYSEIDKSLAVCRDLVEKGYKVSINPSVTTRYTDDELLYIVQKANEIGVYSMYMVDTYGYMNYKTVEHLYTLYNDNLRPEIHIGFHEHNSINMAFANVLHFIDISQGRNILVDSSIMGMGQGAGNLQTELFSAWLLERDIKNINYNKILEACEYIDTFYGESPWGYSLPVLLSALNKTSYKYGRWLREEAKLSYVQINTLLKNIPEDIRHRFTLDNAERLLNG
jgi:4-hydroxy 2-oxovalerate aldolase